MPLTITVTDSLALKLQGEADLRNISVERFALHALGQVVETHEWPRANQRRLTLIRKQFTSELTATEVYELHELQRLADRHLETLVPQC